MFCPAGNLQLIKLITVIYLHVHNIASSGLEILSSTVHVVALLGLGYKQLRTATSIGITSAVTLHMQARYTGQLQLCNTLFSSGNRNTDWIEVLIIHLSHNACILACYPYK